MLPTCQIIVGDALTELRKLPAESVQCAMTSPPYYGLRDYGVEGQIGLEETPDAYIRNIVAVFSEVRRVLKSDGVLWLNLGDSYAGSWGAQSRRDSSTNGSVISRNQISNHPKRASNTGTIRAAGVKEKDLYMIPACVAMALRADGWYLRSSIHWLKRNVMPESVNDRPTTAVEYVFLLTKSPDYYYDKSAVMILASQNTHARLAQDVEHQIGTDRANGATRTERPFKAVCSTLPHDSIESRKARARPGIKSFPIDGRNGIRPKNNTSMDDALAVRVLARNRRNSDWFMDSWQGLLANEHGDPLAFIVNPQAYKGAHFATWPEKLVLPMVLAGSRVGDTVLDPFLGSGTTAKVAIENGRCAIGLELNPAYAELARERTNVTPGLPL
jgi:DNA modification methylase